MKVLTILMVILAVLIVTACDIYFFSAERLRLRRETLSSEKIPADLDGIEIAFFSDVDYGTFMDQERLNKVVEMINDSGCDAVIFGGDLFDEGVTPDETMTNEAAAAFAAIKAPLGKFAVYGDLDHQSEEVTNAVNAVYSASDFEIINNSCILLHNRSSASISLVGIDSAVAGTQDITQAYSTSPHTNYTIGICHTPDTAAAVPSDLTDYFLAGHSRGGQLYWYFGAYYTPEAAVEYFRGRHTVNNAFTLDITNGVGTSGRDMRFLAPAEVVVYTLKSKTAETQSEAQEMPAATSAAQ